MISNDWLTALNDEYSRDGLAMHSRPWHAIQKLANDSQTPITYSSSTAMKIFKWFHNISNPASEQAQFFVGAYLIDTSIVPVSIPVHIGSAAITPLHSLVTLPEDRLLEITNSVKEDAYFMDLFAECYDYIRGVEVVTTNYAHNQHGMRLLIAGDAELESAIAALCQSFLSVKVADSLRKVTEFYLKAFLVLKANYDVKKLGGLTNLRNLMDASIEIADNKSDFLLYEIGFNDVFAENFYNDNDKLNCLWCLFKKALGIASIVLRDITSLDCRSDFGCVQK